MFNISHSLPCLLFHKMFACCYHSPLFPSRFYFDGHFVKQIMAWLLCALSLLTVQTSHDPLSPHCFTQFASLALCIAYSPCHDILALPYHLPCPLSLWNHIHCCHRGSFRWSTLLLALRFMSCSLAFFKKKTTSLLSLQHPGCSGIHTFHFISFIFSN